MATTRQPSGGQMSAEVKLNEDNRTEAKVELTKDEQLSYNKEVLGESSKFSRKLMLEGMSPEIKKIFDSPELK